MASGQKTRSIMLAQVVSDSPSDRCFSRVENRAEGTLRVMRRHPYTSLLFLSRSLVFSLVPRAPFPLFAFWNARRCITSCDLLRGGTPEIPSTTVLDLRSFFPPRFFYVSNLFSHWAQLERFFLFKKHIISQPSSNVFSCARVSVKYLDSLFVCSERHSSDSIDLPRLSFVRSAP